MADEGLRYHSATVEIARMMPGTDPKEPPRVAFHLGLPAMAFECRKEYTIPIQAENARKEEAGMRGSW